jgi:L,D-peptidoglycan transpeptidase YkuD (ErfK/YbiS/YcfS/YnhG family)
MNIILKNKFLYFQKYKLRCSIGKSGISYKKKEGDNKTPKGKFKFKYILYRKDRIFKS